MKFPLRMKLVACFSLKKNFVGSCSTRASPPYPSPRLKVEETDGDVVKEGIGGVFVVGEAFWPFC